ncbi:MAG: TonB domain/peptidase domain protein, partial [Phycisphaerales bacterium]|nr:TonB domain/peptidase domain protein [Phycisphaerales bacterium]
MSLPHFFLESPLIHRIGWTLLHSLWQGLLIALLLAMVLAVLRRRSPQSRYLASCAAMVALAIAPVITFMAAPPPRIASTGLNSIASTASQPESPRATAPDVVISASGSDAPAAESRSVHTIEAGSPIDARSPQSAALSIRATSPAHAARLPLHSMVDRLSPSLPWLVLAWVSGMLALSIRNLGAWVAVQHLKSRSTRPVESAIEQAGERLSQRLGLARRVRFLQSALVDSPLVIGVLKPAVLLPASVLTELPMAQLEALLAHELAHVVRHDYLVNLLQSAIETLLFHHPATWWISRRIRIEREFCCDDIAVRVTRDRSTYIRALAAVAGVPAPALAPAASGGLLLPRLRRMLGLPDPRARGASPWLAGALAVVLCMIAAIAPTLYVPAGAAA